MGTAAVLLSLLSLLARGVPAAFDLVKDGTSTYVIALTPDASPSEEFAAQELAEHLREMTGATLRVEKTATPPERAVVIGVPAARVDAALGDDGYTIRTEGQRLVIAGGKKRGTLYGVYTFLEMAGVRWWTPTERFIPKTSTLTVPALNIREVPKLEYRDIMYQFVFSREGQLWCARNKLNGMAWSSPPEAYGGRYEFVGNLVHGSHQTIARAGKTITPEMQAVVDGRRTSAQLCLSSQATLEAMVAGVLASYEQQPGARFVVIGQQDNRSYCRCDSCAAVDSAEESHAGHNLLFANRVAEEVEKRRPGSNICTAAYQWSRKPPKTLVPRSNVYITLCSIECDFSRPLATSDSEVNKAFRDDFAGWGKICSRLLIWDYVVNFRHFLAPFPNLDAIVPNVKFFADNGARGVFEQAAHTGSGTEFVGLRSWVLAKALWNPEMDGRALIEEFVRGYYGPAAPHILAYIDTIHEPARTRPDLTMGIYGDLTVPYLDPPVIAKAEKALRQAEKAAAGNPDLQRRVRHAHMPLWYVLAKRGPASPMWQEVNRAVAADGGKLDIAHIAREFARVAEENRINTIAEGNAFAPWLQWLTDYAALCADGKVPVPPELKDADLSKVRLIQACQFDSGGRWYVRVAGASDGWAVRQPTEAWTVVCALDDSDHFAPGSTYRLRMRARAVVKEGATGQAWNAGVWRASNRRTVAAVRVTTDQARDGTWRIYDLGVFQPQINDLFYVAAVPAACSEVIVDCLWLEEVASP